MALYLPGMPCGLCLRPFEACERPVFFSPLVPNRLDPLFVFNDAGFHQSCLDSHPMGRRAVEIQGEARHSFTPQNRLCETCGGSIDDPDAYEGTGCLSSDPSSLLSHFNFLHFHRNHIAQWPRLAEFRRLIESVQASPMWSGTMIEFHEDPALGFRWIAPSQGKPPENRK